VQALDFSDPIPEDFAAGFDVVAPSPDWIMSSSPTDFLNVSITPGSGAPVVLSRTEVYTWEGSGGEQSTLPGSVGAFTGKAVWTVSELNVEVPEDGLLLFISGMADSDYTPPPGTGPLPDYPAGSIHVLTSGGDFAGETYAPLAEILFPYGGVDYIYYGVRIFDVNDSFSFAYTGDDALDGGGVPWFANAAQNFVVPEPGSFLLVGAGLMMLAARRRGPARG
jgi:hypothetical protein